MARQLTRWIVEEMVQHLVEDPDVCLVLNPSMVPPSGQPRVVRDGKRWLLHRYFYYRMEGEDSPLLFVRDTTCQTPGCLNPYHRYQVRRGSARVRHHCPNGHKYRPVDVRSDGSRECRRCKRSRAKRWNAARRTGDFPRGWCPKGHRISGDNVYETTSHGKTERKCRTCAIDRQRAYRERKKNGD